MYLLEDTQLHKGIFWIKDPDDIAGTALYFTNDCSSNGDNLTDVADFGMSKDGQSYNHKNTWQSLSRKYTEGKPFNYFPRGRVVIANNRADIYCSPYLIGEELKNWCIDKFNLYPSNGINSVRIIPDNSSHYRCHYDFD